MFQCPIGEKPDWEAKRRTLGWQKPSDRPIFARFERTNLRRVGWDHVRDTI